MLKERMVFGVLFLTVCAIASGSGCTGKTELGQGNQNAASASEHGILGGQPLDEVNDPIARSVAFVPFGKSVPTQNYCSGVFVSQDMVLTSAHCITRPKDKPTYVAVSLPEDGVVFGTFQLPILSIAIHPSFVDDVVGKQFDVAAIKVDSSSAGKFKITPLSIFLADKMDHIPGLVQAAGAGTISMAGPVYNGYYVAGLVTTMIDGNFLVLDQQNGTGACAGDSGAPIYFQNQAGENVLLAIVQGPYKTSPTSCDKFGQAVLMNGVAPFITSAATSMAAQLPNILAP